MSSIRPSGGRPRECRAHLERADGDECWETVGRAETDADGRVRHLVPDGLPLPSGVYRLIFATAAYFARSNTPTFYPHVIGSSRSSRPRRTITFRCSSARLATRPTVAPSPKPRQFKDFKPASSKPGTTRFSGFELAGLVSL